MEAEDYFRLHGFVQGRVQGVGFRMFVYKHALSLNITGWVRNTWKGEVEVMAEGPKTSLGVLLQELRRGPHSSFVSEIRQKWQPYQAEFKTFEIRPSA